MTPFFDITFSPYFLLSCQGWRIKIQSTQKFMVSLFNGLLKQPRQTKQNAILNIFLFSWDVSRKLILRILPKNPLVITVNVNMIVVVFLGVVISIKEDNAYERTSKIR